MHLKLLADDVVLQDLAAPQPSEEEVLRPQRTNRKFLQRECLIKDVDLLKLIEEHLKMQRGRDGQLAALVGPVILKDDSSAISP